MPTLQGDKLSLSDAKKKKAGESSAPAAPEKKPASSGAPKRPPRNTQQRPRPSQRLLDDDDDDDEVESEDSDTGDEIIDASLNSKKEGKSLNVKTIAIAVFAVLAVIIVFVIFMRGRDEPEPPAEDLPTEVTQPPVQTPPPVQDDTPTVVPEDPNLGVQDFTQDTNNTSDTPLSDPNDFTKDINDLTLRVNYEVAAIQQAADMVSYTKRRGTWGGGLELYWLDVTYQEKQYVIQVPFEYYKELSDTGIVPVKMEVLRIASETDGEFLTVISYMSLDEATLKTILRTQQKK